MKYCRKCGENKPLTYFYIDKNTKDGRQPHCKNCCKQRYANLSDSDREIILAKRRPVEKKWRQSLKGRFAEYKKGAIKRNLIWELTIEEFKEYWQKSCSYCGLEIETIGLDRIDSKIGYKKENICACCEFCNRVKRESNVKRYKEWLERISSPRE